MHRHVKQYQCISIFGGTFVLKQPSTWKSQEPPFSLKWRNEGRISSLHSCKRQVWLLPSGKKWSHPVWLKMLQRTSASFWQGRHWGPKSWFGGVLSERLLQSVSHLSPSRDRIFSLLGPNIWMPHPHQISCTCFYTIYLTGSKLNRKGIRSLGGGAIV